LRSSTEKVRSFWSTVRSVRAADGRCRSPICSNRTRGSPKPDLPH
jgi:hypothetical protein